MAEFQVGTAVAGPGQLGFGSFLVGKLSDSTPVEVPVMVMNGAKDGPILLLSAVVHGPEITGTEVIRQICRELVDPADLHGAIIALPIANPFAYREASWHNVEDGFNLNRAFPGNNSNWLTSRLAHAIMENAVKRADAVVDLHCMCEPSMLWTHIKFSGDESLDNRTVGLASAFGLGLVEQDISVMVHRSGGMLQAAAALNIPGITPELLYWRRVDPRSVKVGVRGTMNILRHLEMLEGEIESHDPGLNTFSGIVDWIEIFANEGGLVEFVAMPGDPLAKGQTVARIRNPFGDILESIESPVDGLMLGYPIFNNQAVRTGEMLVFIGSPRE